MKFNCLTILLVILFCVSCGPKVYQKQDYSFYKQDRKSIDDTLLKADGVYELDRINSPNAPYPDKKPKEHRFYKFYAGGQSNLFILNANQVFTEEDYQKIVSADSLNKNNTLFEGYYQTNGQKIIIKSVVTPLRRFEYKYGFIRQDTLMIVKASHQGRGHFNDQNFDSSYREYYIFRPVKNISQVLPRW